MKKKTKLTAYEWRDVGLRNDRVKDSSSGEHVAKWAWHGKERMME